MEISLNHSYNKREKIVIKTERNRSPLTDFTNLDMNQTGEEYNLANSSKSVASKSEKQTVNKCGLSVIEESNKCLTDAEIILEQNVKYMNNEDILHPKEIGDISSCRVEEEDDVFEDAKENMLSLTLLADNLNMIHLSSPFNPHSNNNIIHEFSECKKYSADNTNSLDHSLVLDQKVVIHNFPNDDKESTSSYLGGGIDSVDSEESSNNCFNESSNNTSHSDFLDVNKIDLPHIKNRENHVDEAVSSCTTFISNSHATERNNLSDYSSIDHSSFKNNSYCNNVQTLHDLCKKNTVECHFNNSSFVDNEMLDSFKSDNENIINANKNTNIQSKMVSDKECNITNKVNEIENVGNNLLFNLSNNDVNLMSVGEYHDKECDVADLSKIDKDFRNHNLGGDLLSSKLQTSNCNDLYMESGTCKMQSITSIDKDYNSTNINCNTSFTHQNSDINTGTSITFANSFDQEVQDPNDSSVSLPYVPVFENDVFKINTINVDCSQHHGTNEMVLNKLESGNRDSTIIHIPVGLELEGTDIREMGYTRESNSCRDEEDSDAFADGTNLKIKEVDDQVSCKPIAFNVNKTEMIHCRGTVENGTVNNDSLYNPHQMLNDDDIISSNSNISECKLLIDSSLFDQSATDKAANVSEQIINSLEDSKDPDIDVGIRKTVKILEEFDSTDSKINCSKSSIDFKIAEGTNNCRSNVSANQDMSPGGKCKKSMQSLMPVHLNQSEAGPITASDELSTDDLGFQDGANLDLDFFTRAGCVEGVLRNSLTRDSLYVKFDPIVNKVVSKASSIVDMPLSGEEKKRGEESNSTIDNTCMEIERKCAIINPVLDADQKLISLTPPSASSVSVTPHKLDEGNVATPSNASSKCVSMSQEQLHKELRKLENITKERELYFQNEMSKTNLNLEKKDEELKGMASRQSALEDQLKASTERESKLKKELIERTKSKQQLSLVMEEYEKTISQLVAQKEVEKKEFEDQKDLLMKERDTAMQHLNNMEIAFNDIHQKYERSKTVIEGMKANEDSLKSSLAEYDEAIKSSNTKYESLKNHAILQLETANQELDIMRRTHQAEIAKLKAMLKKAEVRVTSLEESLEQKSKENQELAAICDELINKVGSSGN